MLRLLKNLSAIPMIAPLLAVFASSQQAATADKSCENLARLALPQTTITIAQVVAAGEFKMPVPNRPAGAVAPPGGAAPGRQEAGAAGPGGGPGSQPIPANPEFCRVAATLKPTADSDIKIEVWLPASGWNGKFLGVGNSGLGGSIQYRNMITPLLSGYAAASNSTGHDGDNLSFIPGHPEKFIDYAYRADHEMTVKAKAMIKAFYGTDPRHSYWVGCSLGGVEALTEANRYPEDYDGIVAGSPVNPLTHFNAMQMWAAWLNLKFPDATIPGSKISMINQAAIKACAGPAGLKQSFIDDPLSCHFDPDTLLCKGADAPDCLTAPQVDFLRKLYAGPVNPRTGEAIFPGYAPGTETLLGSDGGAHPIKVAVELYMNAVYQDPNWDWKTMDFDTDIDKANKVAAPIIDVPPDFKAYLDHGGKLMMYVGGAEQLNARYVVNFYETALKKSPDKKDSVRLFVNPGVGHCGGGTGCDTFEKLETIDKWVESGKAPGQLLSSKVSGGKTLRTRPLCAYPTVATYKGTGDLDDAASYSCEKRK
jgi:feruloyl esterase